MEEYSHRFWKEYEEADSIEREELINKLKPIMDIASGKLEIIRKKDKKVYEHMVISTFKTYFDDCIEYYYFKKKGR